MPTRLNKTSIGVSKPVRNLLYNRIHHWKWDEDKRIDSWDDVILKMITIIDRTELDRNV